MQKLTVFCGAAPGLHDGFTQAAQNVGTAIAARNMHLVYGGASTGLMGTLANTALEGGAHVTGVIPSSLVDHEVAHSALTDLRIVTSMHQRKEYMANEADAFLALPGGFGTADELFEIITWTQLGLQQKPIGILNVDGFFNHLLSWIDHCISQSFIEKRYRDYIVVDDDVDSMFTRLGTTVDPLPSLFVTASHYLDRGQDRG